VQILHRFETALGKESARMSQHVDL